MVGYLSFKKNAPRGKIPLATTDNWPYITIIDAEDEDADILYQSKEVCEDWCIG
jgi:hypothetical protein